MNELHDMYQELVLDHSKSPCNHHELESATHQAEGYNPFCGDRVKVYLLIEDGAIRDVAFTGEGCAICTASASMMTQAVRNMNSGDAEAAFDRFHDLLTDHAGTIEDGELDDLGDLASLVSVRRFPIRVKCATLPWHTLKAALHGDGEPVSTE